MTGANLPEMLDNQPHLPMDLLSVEHGLASRLIIGSEIDLPMIVQLNLGTWESRARSVHGIECRGINPWVSPQTANGEKNLERSHLGVRSREELG
ncbi:hypothetical protein N7537_003114 [Penicillium hordei]|uniref:Uncharacterized protein n=1 Tax=Penicillium hordei TaxID=40994 RepID=A0AAD6H9E7_9EURO|nr:uncharacterized protein N7537_003114 [Penicillium hordei]KAJ5618000.1 hypothetical protein N7537_003114 [Penicillium hordei]